MYTGNMEKDLKVLLPAVVATSVAGQDEALANKLLEKAVHIYRHNDTWGRRITDTTKGRDRLYMFMEHWKASFLKNREGE